MRVSLGSLAVLGEEPLAMAAAPSTIYVLQYSGDGCLASCGFCSQSRVAPPALRERLSRIRWPVRRIGDVLDRLARVRGSVERVCLQSVLKRGFFGELLCLTRLLAENSVLPVSVAVTPVHRLLLEELWGAGAERLGVGLDAASEQVLKAVGKPYPWSVYIRFISEAVEVFGRGRVHVHLVAGLGETPAEMLDAMRLIYSVGARVALFRYTPLPGLPRYPGVDVELYRFYQIVRLLLERGYEPLDYAELEPRPRFTKRLPLGAEELADALLTSGCPGCNRPFYNEGVRGPLYNYPSRSLLEKHRSLWLRELASIGVRIGPGETLP